MESRLTPGDPVLIEDIVKYLKAKGIFDEFRHECLADVDTKSSCQNLSQRVDGYTTKFLSGENWHPDLNKNELRNKLRRHIDESGMLAGGADHVVEQVINPKINQLFLPKIIEVVHQYLNEAKEKITKKKESSDDNVFSERPSSENFDGSNKIKSSKIDPIADILSFSYSKPKTNPQNVQTKVTDSIKTDRKKDENVQQAKIIESLPKIEKKKEDPSIPAKVPEIISKLKKEDAVSDTMQAIEKEECVSVKMESVESITELLPAVSPVLQAKNQNDTKESIKIKKEIKMEDSEASSDSIKKFQKEEIKPEKKKGDLEKKKDDPEKKKEDAKLSSDLNLYSEEGSPNKVLTSVPKSSNVKIKSDSDKSKKVKLHSSSKTSSEAQKSKTIDSKKLLSKSSEKHKLSSKVSKMSSKDHSSPHKNGGTAKLCKSDSTEDSNKNKHKDGHTKSSDNSVTKSSSSKSSSFKKESNLKLKPSSEKVKTPKSFDLKPNIKTDTDSTEKTIKSSLQYSSYDSSQGSDQDKSSTSNFYHKEKHKHFSKHHKKEGTNKKSSERMQKTSDRKQFQSDSDSGTPIKQKHVSEKEKKKASKILESAKISSRSNSFGSTSSVSDSPSSSSKETSVSTSEEISDNSGKSSEAKKKKKQEVKEKESCKRTNDFPPPPPPPPASGISAPGSSSAEMSSMDETQSSQDSESDTKMSDNESSSESDVENLYSSNNLKNSNEETKLRTPEILNDVFDVFLYSSSSSEFEGYFSTPELSQTEINKQITDVYVSPINTSELSSFDDFLSGSDCSDVDERMNTRRLTLKEAEILLEEKAKQRRLERSKNLLASKALLDDKKSTSNTPQALTSSLLSELESSPVPEPKRESRRERKLNPKYASSEYTSIFDSKKTSFITKQVSPSENKSENTSPVIHDNNVPCQKGNSLPKRRISMGNLEANQLPDENMKKTSCITSPLQNYEFSDKPKRKLVFDSTEESSWTSETKTYLNSHERNHVILENSDSHIALTIKKSIIKNDNAINKEPRPQGLKRKLVSNEKVDAKKLCRRNSDNSSSSESVPNENNPFNGKTNHLSSVFNVEHKNKDFFHKQKMNKNGVLKLEHVKKKSHPKPTHVIEKQASD